MAFVCTAGQQNVHADYFRQGNAHVILTRIGYDDAEPYNYFAHVGLDISGGNMWEYYFYLVRVNGRTGEENIYWSGYDVSLFIPKIDHPAILNTICSATESLLTVCGPRTVHRCTHDADLPEKALEKHFLISSVFESCGYKVQTADSYHGKRYWVMERG